MLHATAVAMSIDDLNKVWWARKSPSRIQFAQCVIRGVQIWIWTNCSLYRQIKVCSALTPHLGWNLYTVLYQECRFWCGQTSDMQEEFCLFWNPYWQHVAWSRGMSPMSGMLFLRYWQKLCNQIFNCIGVCITVKHFKVLRKWCKKMEI